MPIDPYTRAPVAPTLAVLLPGGDEALTEDRGVVAVSEMPAGYRVWGSWDLVNELWGDGKGEALCWNHRPVRWRPVPSDAKWSATSSTDVRVLRLPFPEEPGEALDGLARWRDWLVKHGAAPQGSLGSSAWSLLRATIRRPIYTSVGQVPPIPFIIGGRQVVVPQMMGRHERAVHYDLPAAYASTLGQMRYGGAWAKVTERYPYRLVASRGVLCFVRARVRVPDMPVGPLPKRPTAPPRGTEALIGFHMTRYPVGKTIQGIWTWEEVEAASEVGCRVKILDVWVLASGDGKYPFKPWWEAVLDGRGMVGFAGLLGKATGNAMWGQFAISPVADRSVIRWNGDRVAPVRFKRDQPLAGRSPYYAPDLAETLTGRVRADLYRCMVAAGPPLVCAHTDGIWTEGEVRGIPSHWRPKVKVWRLDMLTPQFLRFWVRQDEEPSYVVAGAPDTLAPAIFDKAWNSLASEGKVPA